MTVLLALTFVVVGVAWFVLIVFVFDSQCNGQSGNTLALSFRSLLQISGSVGVLAHVVALLNIMSKQDSDLAVVAVR